MHTRALRLRRPSGGSHATTSPYGPFPAGDGKTVMLGLQNEREWTVFCEKVLQQPELAADARYASNSRRSAARDELRRMIIEVFAQLSAAEVGQRRGAPQTATAP